MSAIQAFRDFRYPGPIAQSFAEDRSNMVRAILGPQGGGKSVTCIFDLLSNASRMPVCKDGKIHFRVAIIRDTYGRLQETTIPTWLQWLPKDGGDWTDADWEGGAGRQAHHRIAFDTIRNGQRVEVAFEAIFAAIGDQSVEDFMRGFEVSAFWFNELDLLSEDVLTYGIGRIGRYPAIHMLPENTPLRGFPGYTLGNLPPGHTRDTLPPGTLYRDFIIGDLNAPDIDSWFYRRFEEEKPKGFQLYKQPGGRSPKAENLHNLKPGYYAQQATLNASKPKWIKRFIDAQYGPSDNGEVVYPEYSDDVHLSAERIAYDPSRPIYLGFDQGLRRPAGVVLQRTSSGQWVVLLEVVPGRMNAKRFAEVMLQALNERCPGWVCAGAWADPAGFDGADKEADDFAWAETVMHILQVPILAAPTNEIDPRQTAVRDELVYLIGPDKPGIILSRGDTPLLRKGFVSDYCYKRRRIGNTDRFDDVPDKSSPTADPHDGLQYVLLGAKGISQVKFGGRGGRMATTGAAATTVIRSTVLSGR